jgi:parallel beta-helix repeat protein
MFKFKTNAFFVGRGRRGRATSGDFRRHLRNRLGPDFESLEVRDCPSTLGLLPGSEHAAHSLAIVRHGTHQEHDAAALLKKTRAATPTIYVAPKGKTGAAAGRTLVRPLGSLALALRRAKPGATIILMAGVYTQDGRITGKSGVTIDGAGEGVTVLAGAGRALNVLSSSGITIENLSFRSGSSGSVGLAMAQSSVTLKNIDTDGTDGDGVLVGQGGTLTADSSHFDKVITGSGLELQPGSSATITNSTFDSDGFGPNATTSSNGLRVDGGASATITGSEFNGNANAGLTAYGAAAVTVKQSTFSGNVKGDGALIQDQTTATFTGDIFSSNGVTVGESTGLNGLEFLSGYSGAAVVTGNSFLNNTANGIYVGGSATNIQIAGNHFQGNVGGIFLDSTLSTVHATVQGNTFTGQPASPPIYYQGIIAVGGGLTATIGGSGAAANTLTNYIDGNYIYEAQGANGSSPNVTILTNVYTFNGTPVPPSQAIHYA